MVLPGSPGYKLQTDVEQNYYFEKWAAERAAMQFQTTRLSPAKSKSRCLPRQSERMKILPERL
jgi:hypothetical protein